MRGFPYVLQTGQDLYNCLALVRLGELPADELLAEIDRIERSNYIHAPVRSRDGRTATVGYLYEACIGMEVADNLRITAIEHIAGEAEENAPEGEAVYQETILTFNRIVPASIDVISIPGCKCVLESMGITKDQLQEAREATVVEAEAKVAALTETVNAKTAAISAKGALLNA